METARRTRIVSSLTRLTRNTIDDPVRRLQLSLVLLLALNIVGTIAYVIIEGWSFVDAFYMTVITIGTVGFGEVETLSPAGRVFTVVLIYLGIGTATTALTNAAALALGPLLWGSLQERRMRKMIENLKNHYIVCGYGRMGRQIIRDLQMRGEPFVLIDANADLTERLLDERIPFIIGDATNDDSPLHVVICSHFQHG
ncbi:MAG: potassium channel family protein [Chloroflexota bacterium]